MSEFGDGYYLHRQDAEKAVALIKALRRYGVVLPEQGSYVPFFVEGLRDAQGMANDVVTVVDGTVLRYFYAEDHGVWLSAFSQGAAAFEIELQRRGPSHNDRQTILQSCAQLGLAEGARLESLRAVLELAAQPAEIDVAMVRERLGASLGVDFVRRLGCADLSFLTEKELLVRFPTAQLVLKSRRGLVDKESPPAPNRWCPASGLPAFMYLPVPEGFIDETMLERHVRHWLETRDWDDVRQVGFWVYNAYRKALPSEKAFLANRIMNLGLAFPPALYEQELRTTIRGILAVSDPAFDWTPYLAQRAGESRL